MRLVYAWARLMLSIDLCVYCGNSWLSVECLWIEYCFSLFYSLQWNSTSVNIRVKTSYTHILTCVCLHEWMYTFCSMECLWADDKMGQFILGFAHVDEYYWNFSLNNNCCTYFTAFFSILFYSIQFTQDQRQCICVYVQAENLTMCDRFVWKTLEYSI